MKLNSFKGSPQLTAQEMLNILNRIFCDFPKRKFKDHIIVPLVYSKAFTRFGFELSDRFMNKIQRIQLLNLNVTNRTSMRLSNFRKNRTIVENTAVRSCAYGWDVAKRLHMTLVGIFDRNATMPNGNGNYCEQIERKKRRMRFAFVMISTVELLLHLVLVVCASAVCNRNGIHILSVVNLN